MLFQQIPQNFFLPLAGPNKMLYWECIYKLYNVMNHQLSFGVFKELVIDELQFLFETLQESLEVEGEVLKSSRDKATYTYRKLLEYGWLAKEETNNYEERIHFQDYAIEIVKTLQHIAEHDKMEYQGYVYTIYTLIRSQGDEMMGKGIVLNQIYENTHQLITGLKSLNANIKKYIDQLTHYESVAELMKVLFEDYRKNIVDKAYHRLKTSDNVSKYRPSIIEGLENFLGDESFIEVAAKEMGEIKGIKDEQQAKEQVIEMIRDIREAFSSLDEIIEEIDSKNSSYQRAAINRAKFLLSYGEDISGQIKEILIRISSEISEKELSLNSIYTMDFMENLFTLYGTSFYEEESLYKPVEGRKDFTPEKLTIKEIDKEKRAEKLRLMKLKLQQTMSVQQIEAYVYEILGEKQVLCASQFPTTSKEDFVKLIYIRLYGQRRQINYRIVPKESVIKGGYRFRDFEIWRKK